MRTAGILAAVAFTAGCHTSSDPRLLRPSVDLSPLSCGYKWFQSGHAMLSCDEYQVAKRERLVELARADAWEIANQRCPVACPPVELKDTAETDGPASQAGCRGGIAYYPSRVFFQCSSRSACAPGAPDRNSPGHRPHPGLAFRAVSSPIAPARLSMPTFRTGAAHRRSPPSRPFRKRRCEPLLAS